MQVGEKILSQQRPKTMTFYWLISRARRPRTDHGHVGLKSLASLCPCRARRQGQAYPLRGHGNIGETGKVSDCGARSPLSPSSVFSL